MTIDEKIEKAAEKFHPCEGECDSYGICLECSYANTFRRGANFLKSEMLADMQKLAEALEKAIQYGEFAEWAIEENESLQKLDVDARQALAEFNAKYKEKK